MSRPNVSSILYDKLPNVYKNYDATQTNNFPLKKLLAVLGSGLDFMEQSIQGVEDIYDLDNCPEEFLPIIVEQMGFEYPYALTDTPHRTLVKALPYLYKNKGTSTAFAYLAREIFGSTVQVDVTKAQYTNGMDVSEWRKIFVNLTASSEQLSLDTKESYFRKFAELVRPVNTILVIALNTFFDDVYDSDALDDTYTLDYITVNPEDETYSSASITESESTVVSHPHGDLVLDNTYFTLDGLFWLDDIQQDGTLLY